MRIPGRVGVVGAGAPFARPFTIVPLADVDPFWVAGADADAETDGTVLFTFGTVVVAPARCGEDIVASPPTRLLLLSAFDFSGCSLMVFRAGWDPKLGDL